MSGEALGDQRRLLGVVGYEPRPTDQPGTDPAGRIRRAMARGRHPLGRQAQGVLEPRSLRSGAGDPVGRRVGHTPSPSCGSRTSRRRRPCRGPSSASRARFFFDDQLGVDAGRRQLLDDLLRLLHRARRAVGILVDDEGRGVARARRGRRARTLRAISPSFSMSSTATQVTLSVGSSFRDSRRRAGRSGRSPWRGSSRDPPRRSSGSRSAGRSRRPPGPGSIRGRPGPSTSGRPRPPPCRASTTRCPPAEAPCHPDPVRVDRVVAGVGAG